MMMAVVGAFLYASTAAAGVRYLVKQDFESAKDPTLIGWASPNLPGGMSVAGDEWGNYFQFSLGQSNGRSCYWLWGSDVYTDQLIDGTYRMEMEWCYKQGSNNQYGTQLRFLNSDEAPTNNGKTANSNALDQYNWIFTLTEADADRNFYICDDTNNTFLVNVGEWMKIVLDVNVNDRTVAYTITNATGDVEYVKGVRNVPEKISIEGSDGTTTEYEQSMYITGINQYNARYQSIVQMDNINVSVFAEEDIANPPTVALTGVNGIERTYTITFGEEEELNIEGTDGKTEEIFYMDCDGMYKYTTTTSGTLKAWTVSGTATSDVVTVDVECVEIALPGATAAIVGVEDGYAKTYQLTVSNEEVPTQPTIFLMYQYKNEKGEIEVSAEDKFSGEKVDVKEKGVLTITSVAPGFGSTTVEVVNDKQFQTTDEIDFQHMTAEDLTAKGFEAMDPLDSESTSGETNWTGRQRFYYNIATGEVDEEGNPTYTKYVVYGASTLGFEPIQRYRFLQSKLDETAARSLFAPMYTWWFNDGITATSLNEEGTGPAVDDNGNEGGSVNIQIKLGIGLVHSGVQGDAETYDPAGRGYGNIRVNNTTLGVDGLTDEDFIVVYKINDYGSTSKHPEFPAGTDPEVAKEQYKAMHLGDLVEIYTGLQTFQLYRVDTALNYIRILKGDSEGIEEINTGAIVSDHNAPIYNLNGIQVNPKTLQRGVYIKQGKKFIVR